MTQRAMTPPFVAIVVPTTGEDLSALRRAIASAVAVSRPVRVVSQAGSERIAQALSGFGTDVRLIVDSGRGASRARNLGLAEVDSEWVLFLDDDAELLGDFRGVLAALRDLETCSVLAWRVIDEDGNDISRYVDRDVSLSKWNHWKLTREHSTLWRVPDLRALGGFDEELGPGVWAGSDECADLMIRLLASGRHGRYVAICGSRHPDASGFDKVKVRSYGRGTGRLIRKHCARPASWPYAVRAITGTASVVLPRRFHRYARRAKAFRALGIAEGLLLPRRGRPR